ncbi:MAG: HAMP domain-containing histidine kinase [Pirellulales bacterium]|nr:HAMP domain-containing histidine kinase [Pirellulales bacterium]
MRWPLHYQLMALTAAMMAIVLLLVSAVTAYLSARRVQDEVHEEVRQLAVALSDAQYPLTSPVLEQIHGLSGVHLILRGNAQQTVSTSGGVDFGELPETVRSRVPANPEALQLDAPALFGSERYFHTVAAIPPRGGDAASTLHLFYPEERWRQARGQALLLPWMVGLVALPLVVILAAMFAMRLSRPIISMRDQVQQIASGRYASRVSAARSDEVGQLADAMNDLAEQLERFDHETRHNERLRVLNQLGSGIAHQMRNAVTGALMAADVHERTGDEESLEIVRRQLRLLESNINRFLTQSQPSDVSLDRLDFNQVASEAIELVRPAFNHVNVSLDFQPNESGSCNIQGNRDALHDAMTNLLLNAMEAAVAGKHRPCQVDVSIESGDRNNIVRITDTGDGLPEGMTDHLFEPFATSKPEGTGLGLFVVKRTMEDHGGTIRWQRDGDRTTFVLEFPGEHT